MQLALERAGQSLNLFKSFGWNDRQSALAAGPPVLNELVAQPNQRFFSFGTNVVSKPVRDLSAEPNPIRVVGA